jgi:hypothetical protein
MYLNSKQKLRAMQKPKIFKWRGTVERRKNEWKDWNGKQSYDYFIELPEWLARAYHLDYRQVIVTIWSDGQSMSKMSKRATNNKYFKENWSKKQTKKRKLNHGYIKIKVIK